MQQRFVASSAIEVTTLAPEHDVGEEACAEQHMLAELRQLGRSQTDKTVGQYGGQTDRKRREDAPDAPSIEDGEREVALSHFSKKYRRDEKARNDEEDVYAHIA